jgi:hypothetical protein
LFLDLVAQSECSVLVGPGERNALEQKSNREGAQLAAFPQWPQRALLERLLGWALVDEGFHWFVPCIMTSVALDAHRHAHATVDARHRPAMLCVVLHHLVQERRFLLLVQPPKITLRKRCKA